MKRSFPARRRPSPPGARIGAMFTGRVGAGALAAALLPVLVLAPVGLPTAAFGQAAAPAATRFRGEPVTLNFVNADIEGVSRAMSAILNQQFIVDPRVKGTITLYSEQPLSPREAYLNFLAALRGLGFTVVEVGGLFKIVPEADAKLQTGQVSIGDVSRKGDQVITQIFRLNHENANNMVPVLRPLISPNNTINANPGNNTLVITDYADNLQRIAKIIAAMDTPSSGEVEVITLQYAVAADIATLVQRLADASGAQGAPGAVQGQGSSVLVDARSNSLIVRAANPARMASIRGLVAKLDRPIPGSNVMGNIWVVYLKNADSAKLASVLRAAFSSSAGGGAGGGGGGGAGGAGGATSPFGANAAANNPTNVNNSTGTSGASTQATAPVSGSASPSTGGFIQADPATNSLIITAPEPLYRQLRAVIDQLDSRRAQVYIESLIVEVDATKAADLGVQWQGIIGGPGDQNIIGLGSNFGTGADNIIGASQIIAGGATAISGATLGSGFNIGVARKFGSLYTLSFLARALETNAGTNILSTPNLVTLDNEEAKIVVGQNVPFVTGQYTNTGTGSTTSPFQTIERKDVGTTLRIRPQIGENGTIRMVIYQESSSVAATAAVGTSNAGPTTNKRSIESTITVDDGQIIVLGGLIEDTYDSNRSKVPLLGDIPYLGALFRSENRTRKKTNLMVFLRPVVMRDQATTNRLSLDRYDYIRSEQLGAQPASNGILGQNQLPVLPPVRPGTSGPADAPRPLGDVSPPPPVMPSVPVPSPSEPVVEPVSRQPSVLPPAPAASPPSASPSPPQSAAPASSPSAPQPVPQS